MYVERVPPATRPNPQKRNIILKRLKKAPWWLLLAVIILVYIYGEWSDDTVYRTIWNSVKSGIEVTILVSVRAYAIALVLGLVLALMRLSDNIVLYQVGTFYVEIVRGIPTLILVFYVALALTPRFIDWLNGVGDWMLATPLDIDLWLFDIKSQNLDLWGRGTYFSELITRDIDQTYRVMAALAISYSAFLSEIFRAGIQSIDKGQIEAAHSVGLNRFQTMRLVVLPQAIRIVLPPLGNDFIAMLKESSLVSVVGVEDVTRRGQTTAASTFRVFETYNIVALTYLVLTLSLAIAMKLFENYIRSGRPISIRPMRRRAGAVIASIFERFKRLFNN